ncbi:MAG TPA: CsbD family protein [Lachnospiraceae bacterium]|nr:CsbD family protein [Lachnospiraceae bacterium]HEX3078101.1 CsbD family protein [Lachnospiraceae bacterium]
MKEELENGMNKIVGKAKETVGKMTDSVDLEFKGKMQSIKADIGNKVEDMKDEMKEKANKIIDRMRDDR